MSKSITVRDVPDDVRNELAARAAAKGQSLQEHLRLALIELAARPTHEALLARVAARKAAAGTRVSAAQILKYRDEGRR